MGKTTSSDIHELAAAAGVERRWRDVDGREQMVADDALSVILLALGYTCGSGDQIQASLRELTGKQDGLPPMSVTEIRAGDANSDPRQPRRGYRRKRRHPNHHNY